MKTGKYYISARAFAGILTVFVGWAASHLGGIEACAQTLGAPPIVVQSIGWCVGAAAVFFVSQTAPLVRNGDSTTLKGN